MGTRRKDGIVGNANSRNPRIVGKTIFGNVAVITPGSIRKRSKNQVERAESAKRRKKQKKEHQRNEV